MRSALMVLVGLLLTAVGLVELPEELRLLREGEMRQAKIVSTEADRSVRGPTCWHPVVVVGSASPEMTIDFPCRSKAAARAAVGATMHVRVHPAERDRVRDPRGWPRDLAFPIAVLLAGVGLVLEPLLSRRFLMTEERRDIGNVLAVTIGPGLVIFGWAVAWDFWVADRYGWSLGMASGTTFIFAGLIVMLRRGYRRGTAAGS